MSNQPENENQQHISPEEVRQSLLTEIDATRQAIVELSDEKLEEVAGGGLYLNKGPYRLREAVHALTFGLVKPYKPISSSPEPSVGRVIELKPPIPGLRNKNTAIDNPHS